MMTPDIEQLNKQFSIQNADQSLQFTSGVGGVPMIEIQNSQATARISLQGAHVLSWVPTGEDDVIWLSEDATFAPGKSVRGGIPICWPWFGPHESNAAFPAHGFARTVLWQVIDAQALAAGETQITFRLDTHKLDASLISKNNQHMWPSATIAEYRLTIGKALTMELVTLNQSDQPITIGQALHTYFSVNDVTHTLVHGLDGKEYVDKTDDMKRKQQKGAVDISSEVDRVYLDTPEDTVIDDKKRKITIKKEGSHTTVVWNPWEAVAEKMGDLGKEGYLKMLCVESANALNDTVRINPGDKHTLRVIYAVEGK